MEFSAFSTRRRGGWSQRLSKYLQCNCETASDRPSYNPVGDIYAESSHSQIRLERRTLSIPKAVPHPLNPNIRNLLKPRSDPGVGPWGWPARQTESQRSAT
jgi:hypothetical protein